MMAGFYCTASPFIKLNSKVVFISLFWFLSPFFVLISLFSSSPKSVVFDSVSTIMMGETKQFLMVKSSSLSAYNLILAMVAWWMPVLESSTNLGQMRKMPKEPL